MFRRLLDIMMLLASAVAGSALIVLSQYFGGGSQLTLRYGKTRTYFIIINREA